MGGGGRVKGVREGIAVGWRAGVRSVAADAGAGFDRAIGEAGCCVRLLMAQLVAGGNMPPVD